MKGLQEFTKVCLETNGIPQGKQISIKAMQDLSEVPE